MNPSLYARPNKPRKMTVTRREDAPEMARPQPVEILEVDSFTECHITPDEVAETMASYLYDNGGLILEPQAGTGALIEGLNAMGFDIGRVVAVERHIKLSNTLHERFNDGLSEIVNDCFLEFAQRIEGRFFYQNIIMNPPFKAVKKHMKAALSLLSKEPDSSLVALVPVTYQHEDAETLDILDNETFPTAKVNTKIIRFLRA